MFFSDWQDRFRWAAVPLQIAELQFGGLLLIDENETSFVIGIVSKTAPWPLLRLQHQPALYRIAVDVAELLQSLGVAPDYEIVEPPLPHVSFSQPFIPELAWDRSPRARDRFRLFRAKRCFSTCITVEGVPFFRFANQQMEVLRHSDVADDDAPIAAAHLLEQLHKQTATLCCAQDRTAVIATRGDEMQVAAAVTSSETFWACPSVNSRWRKRCDG